MDVGELRQLLARWASRQPLIARVHVVGDRARGVADRGAAVELVVEVDGHARGAEDAAAIARWQGQLASALPVPVTIDICTGQAAARAHAALRRAHICAYERVARAPDPA